jgi:co-chaperonin GroES (HSP10)
VATATAKIGKIDVSDDLKKEAVVEATAKMLPKPEGFKILIMLPKAELKSEGGIIKSAVAVNDEQVGSITGFVLDMGPDCYLDKKRFPSGPWCKVGDWVMFKSYSGTRFKIHGTEMRLINDDSIDATLEDPRGVIKA